MKRFLTIMLCTAAMMAASLSAKAQEVTITLFPGWTWISYPNAETMDISSALGDFVPANGDIILSQYSSSTYVNGYWRGGVTHFMPGWGYKYYSNRSEVVSFVFAGSTPQAQVFVTTSEPLLITAISAMCGGEVTVSDGTYILVKGLCWATHENPTTNDDFYQEAESGVGSFSISMTELNISTTYYVRAYAVTPNGTVYGEQKFFTTRDGIPTLTTTDITNIGSSWAISGGNITDNGGLNVMARGVCWSTSPNPTIDDCHTTDGTGIGGFVSYLTGLNVNTSYYVRSYASTVAETAYGEQKTFTTLDNLTQIWVDLGLPSGTLWATCNIGAEVPWEYGDYFAWGGTSPNQYCPYYWDDPDNSGFGKYWYTDYYDEYWEPIGDNLAILLPEDDAATVNWGADWRMPNRAEWQELLNNTTSTWTTQNGVYGRLFIASNGSSLFLPAASSSDNNNGYYWSSSGGNWGAKNLYFNSDNCEMNSNWRCEWCSVRAVRSTIQNNTSMGTINGLFSVSDDSQVYFSQGNLQYNALADTWRFALNQYDYIGSNNSNMSSSYNGYIDLFGWGASGYNHGAGCYQPWSTSQNDNNYYAYGNYQYNLCDQTGQADWGYNAISNGGNNVWRTLTTQEWQYVFNTRTTTSGIRYAKAEVDGVCGVILLPDNWNSSYYSLSNFNSGSVAYNSNIITSSQWSVLELYGAVFLPAAGIRNGTSVSGVGSYGRYWSSSYYDSNNAYHVYFNDSELYADYTKNRCRGRSVRLVCSSFFIINVTSNPTGGGEVSGGGDYELGTECTLTATANTGYIFRNWMENGTVVSTEATYSFHVTGNRNLVATFVSSGGGTHQYVDLGLPSGTMWATCNVGANAPEEYGEYFAWGETQPKDTYNWSTYQYCMGSSNTLTKYCISSNYGYNGFTDNLTTLLPEDDAATANWGSDWRMPTKEEFQELYNNTTVTWTTQNGVNGRLFTASNGNSLFLPAAGYRDNSSLSNAGSGGDYRSSSLNTGHPGYAWGLDFNSVNCIMGSYYRVSGFTVRPVRSSRQN